MKFRTLDDYRSFSYPLSVLLLLNSASLDAAIEDELFFDMPIVLSANRLEQRVSEAAVSISVIDRETIEASGARTIPEVLRLIPGMQVGYSGNEFGDEPKYVVAYHGQSDQYSKQMQVLVDGRSIYEPFFGGINWKSVPVNIDDIERIEVSRGPNLATYGSNSFQAAINIITRTAAEDQGSYLRANAGNHDIADLTYRYGNSNGNLDYRVTASTLNDDGLDSGNQFDHPDDTQSNNIDYRLDYQINNSNSISYQGGYGTNSQQADRNHEDLIPTARTIENTQLFQFIKWESVINTENTLLMQYYYNLSDKEDRYSSEPIPAAPFDTFVLDVDADIKSERHNLELTHFITPNESLKLWWGLSAQADQVKSPLYLVSDEKITHEQYRVFANIEWFMNRKNMLNVGGLLEKNDFSKTEFSPRISLTHAFNRKHKVRVGISQAIRNPFIYEALGELSYSQDLTVGGAPSGLTLLENVIRGNIELENEKIISHEIAYFGEFMDASLLFNARLFYDKVSNYIDTLRETDAPPGDPSVILYDDVVLVFRNPIDNATQGLELELDYHIDNTLRLIASGAIININSNSLAMSLSAPQHSFSLFLTKDFNEKYNGSLGYYYVEDFTWTDSRGTGDYNILDIRASRNFRFDKTHGSLSIVLKNLLDDYSDYNANPRNSTSPLVIQNTVAYLDFRLSF
ncbi:MAG: TonB-dependent receptor [Gammaproteobacteria bacterium]|nr:TonB-dependent receptor [Gammaproteobacteria bacterium]NNJ49691.1 TonB-dependent receptor [Gammaproteobacteria bacterium]